MAYTEDQVSAWQAANPTATNDQLISALNNNLAPLSQTPTPVSQTPTPVTPPPPMAPLAYDTLVRNAYKTYAGLDPNTIDANNEGLNYWTGQLNSGALKPQDFDKAFSYAVNQYATEHPDYKPPTPAPETPTNFNADAYLAANKDVSDAYKTNNYGMTPEQFALYHYQNYGAQEHRPSDANVIYDKIVKDTYATEMGLDPKTIDANNAGLNYWKSQLASGAVKPQDFQSVFENSANEYVKSHPSDAASTYFQNYQLNQQKDTIKSNYTKVLEDNNISFDEANSIQAYQEQYGFKPEDIAKVTGLSLAAINQILGAKDTIIGKQVTSNLGNPLAIANFANQYKLDAKKLADASGGQLTAAQAQDYLDKSQSYQGRLQLVAPDAYNKIASLAQYTANENFGGKIQDYQVQIFAPLATNSVDLPKQLEFNPIVTGRGVDEDGNPTINRISGGDVKTPGVDAIYSDEGGIAGYVSKTPTYVNGLPVFAQYDEKGKVTGYQGDTRVVTWINGSQYMGGKWDAEGNAQPWTHTSQGGGFIKNALADLGPIANIALAFATDGMSLEWQVASSAALQFAQGVPLDKALTNAAASYAGQQVVNIPEVKNIISGIDSTTLQNMVKSGISSATSAGILNQNVGTAALAGATGAAVSGVVTNMTKDLELTPNQTKIVGAAANTFTKAKLLGATDEQALQAAAQAGGMSTAKSIFKSLKDDKTSGLTLGDDTLANLDNIKYDSSAAQQVIDQFKLATDTTTSKDPGVDVAGPGAGNMASISAMTPMLGVAGETSSKIGYDATNDRYVRTITGTTKDGKDYQYEAFYYNDPIKGSNVWYRIPGGSIGSPDTVAPDAASTVESRTRPTFDTDATSTDGSTSGSTVGSVSGTKSDAAAVKDAVDAANKAGTQGVTGGTPGGVTAGVPGGVTGGTPGGVSGPGGLGNVSGPGGPGGAGPGGSGGTGPGGPGDVSGPGGPGGTSVVTPVTTVTPPPTTTTTPPTTIVPTDKTKQAIAAPSSSSSGTSGSTYGAIPGALAASNLAAGPITEGKKIMSDLHQLYPQISNIDPKLLALLSGTSTPKQVETASNVPNMPAQAAQSATGKSNNPLSSLVGMLGGKFGADNGFSALSAAGLQMLGGGTGGALPAFAQGGTVDHKPEFITGATGHYVKGGGDGQSDSIPAMLADGEYVFDADTVAALGNGSSDAGAKLLDKMRENLRKHKRSAPVNKIPPKSKSPLEYMKG